MDFGRAMKKLGFNSLWIPGGILDTDPVSNSIHFAVIAHWAYLIGPVYRFGQRAIPHFSINECPSMERFICTASIVSDMMFKIRISSFFIFLHFKIFLLDNLCDCFSPHFYFFFLRALEFERQSLNRNEGT